MKRLAMFSITLLFTLSVYCQNTKLFSGYDNLEVLIHTLPNADYTVEKDRNGVYTFNFIEKITKNNLLLSLYTQKNNSFNISDYQSNIKRQGEKLLPQAEETSIVVKNINDESGIIGYYYLVTDRTAKQEDNKYLIQGFIKYNYMLGYFTYLSNNADVEEQFNKINIKNIITNKPLITNTTYFEGIKLSSNDVLNLSLQYIKHFYSNQQVIFYNHPEAYESILPKLLEKYSQRFCSDKEEGTVFYYYFSDNIESKKGFITGLFYGDSKPNQDNPEKIIINGNYLIVFSYPYKSKIADDLIQLINNKIK